MVAAGLLAKKAVERGLSTKPWVKASLAPGSKVVTDYLKDAGLDTYLDQLRFNLVGYGCTTCIGNSGPLAPGDLQGDPRRRPRGGRRPERATATSRGGSTPRSAPITSPRPRWSSPTPWPARWTSTSTNEPLGHDPSGQPVYLRDIWPTQREVHDTVLKSVRSEMFHKEYGEVFKGDEHWNSLPVPQGDLYEWDDSSTYVKNPPYFVGMTVEPEPVAEIRGPAPWRSWATASPPTTSRRRARSRCRARRDAT